jgi:asparagine synthase (glutamine-hydrolysing)
MCGICGIYNKSTRQVDADILRKMNNAMVHRGPDDWGMEIDRFVGIAMRRLSIIDIKGGHQPIHNEDQTIWTVFNGEIYNFRQLRQHLEEKGHKFYTNSDTETIVHLYEEYGDEFVSHLRGMFTIAIWDKKRERLIVARDHIGIKPLFFYNSDTILLFASEIKSILQHPAVVRELDYSALDAYFTNCFIPAPKTIFKNLHKLLPGHLLVVEKGEVATRQYWELDFYQQNEIGFEEAVQQFRSYFYKAVQMRMIAEVPLGAFLSGGIDSSAVVGIMSKISDRPVKTFSIGFEGDVGDFDETEDARRVAKLFQTEHHELIVKPDVREIAEWMATFFDEPFSNSSAIPNYYVCKMARKEVTVALSGLGGDEIAVGYPRHLGLQLARYYHLLPQWVREKMLPNIVQHIPEPGKDSRITERLKRFVKSGSGDLCQNYMGYMTYLSDEDRRKLYTANMYGASNGYTDATFDNYFNRYPSAPLINRAAFTDIKIDLPENLLALTDRMSMAVSLEVRVPFLDIELMQFMAALPAKYKTKGLQNKYFLKKSFSDILPNEVLYKKKQGFSIPLAMWFRERLKPFVEEILSPERVAATEVLNAQYVQVLLDEHFRQKNNHYRTIWSLIIFVLWHEANLGN